MKDQEREILRLKRLVADPEAASRSAAG